MLLLVKYFANIFYLGSKYEAHFLWWLPHLFVPFSVHLGASLQSFILKSANEIKVIQNTENI